MGTLSIQIHEAWLMTLSAGFMSHGENKQKLFEFSDILFRHFTWVERELVKNSIRYDYNRDMISIKTDQLTMLLNLIVKRLGQIDLQLIGINPDLSHRISSDIKYITNTIIRLPNEKITAFDTNRKYKDFNLSQMETDALTLFLFEESYKEYELIMTYNYLKIHSNDAYMNEIYQNLIEESFFHLKNFGDMMSEMGILTVPRVIPKEMYQIDNIKNFMLTAINEEKNAKEECRKLSEIIGNHNPQLAKFFEFINNQENYHIALMKDALLHMREGIRG